MDQGLQWAQPGQDKPFLQGIPAGPLLRGGDACQDALHRPVLVVHMAQQRQQIVLDLWTGQQLPAVDAADVDDLIAEL